MTWKDINFSVPLTKEDKQLLERQKKIKVNDNDGIPTFDQQVNLNIKHVGNTMMKRILTNISGFAKPKELVSIMGASGSGKTSLLNFLAQRLALSPGAMPEGEVQCNGRVVSVTDFGKIGAFVQ